MKTFYSILSLNIRPEINERLSIGMILISKETILFRYSKHKLSLAQKLVSKETYKSAAQYLLLIEKSIKENEIVNHSYEELALNPDNKYKRIFSEQYIAYLSRYNNNLLSFSNPKLLDFKVNPEVFKKLFVKFIDESAYNITEKEHRKLNEFKKEYYPKVKLYFNIEEEIDSTQFEKLLSPVKVDLLGKNNIEVFAQFIDFEKNTKSIEYHIGGLLQINRAIPRAKQFVIACEPDKQLDINHRIWNNIRKTSEFEYVDFSEAEQITDYAISHNVKPLFD